MNPVPRQITAAFLPGCLTCPQQTVRNGGLAQQRAPCWTALVKTMIPAVFGRGGVVPTSVY